MATGASPISMNDISDSQLERIIDAIYQSSTGLWVRVADHEQARWLYDAIQSELYDNPLEVQMLPKGGQADGDIYAVDLVICKMQYLPEYGWQSDDYPDSPTFDLTTPDGL
ncbi:hypothetical protein [Halosegnis longus]|uniref:hypothetical protein n=1 Tax=Halosegnis longus TaxID=2216012 RepID=UPI00129D3E85|nr:hypothetical protein [Halosegnis longus]